MHGGLDLGPAPLVPVRDLAAAFRVAVRVVVPYGPEPEMVEVHARRVVAAVQHAEPIGDLSVLDLPGHAVGQTHPALEPDLSMAALRGGAACIDQAPAICPRTAE